MKIKQEVKLYEYTTMKVGGRARYFIKIEQKEEVKKAMDFIKEKGLSYFVMGGGSNLLIDDKDLNIAIIKLTYAFLNIEGTRVRVSSSFKLPRLINVLIKEGLSGIEELAEIPGEIGGAVMMNAGSFGKEIGEVVSEIEIFDGRRFRRLGTRDLVFSYRNTNIKRDWIITEVNLRLAKGSTSRIMQKIQEVKEQRRRTQPVGQRTFGSVFKNPDANSAGYLIERCNLKGYQIGDAKISEKHANFIVNTNRATFSDIISLMNTAKSAVYKRFGIKLEPEVIILRSD